MIVSQEPKKWFTSHYQLKISMSGLLYYYSATGDHNHDGNIEATISHCGQFKSTCHKAPSHSTHTSVHSNADMMHVHFSPHILVLQYILRVHSRLGRHLVVFSNTVQTDHLLSRSSPIWWKEVLDWEAWDRNLKSSVLMLFTRRRSCKFLVWQFLQLHVCVCPSHALL